MASKMKTEVLKGETLDKLEIRLGRVMSVEEAVGVPKKSYLLKVDFGKFGSRVSVGRFTNHTKEELIGQLVLGVLNLGTVSIGSIDSEVLILGVQFPKEDSGEATFITPSNTKAKIGGKLF
ncbi:MAG: hypothetical protein WBA74_10860 [Cyclobacteriaceae bacterium]